MTSKTAFALQTLFSTASRDRCMAKMMKFRIPRIRGKEPTATAAVLIPICSVEDTPSLLYTLRADNLRSHSGQISFPGGKKDNNETPIQTALRETEEEIGLSRTKVEVWGQGPAVPGRNNKIMITPVVGTIKRLEEKDLDINEDEVAEIFTLPLETLCDKKHQFYTQFSNGYILPVYKVDHYRIWGVTAFLTHMFLSSLLTRDIYNNEWMKQKVELK
ncbi:mitochondrial coenzyme A diphosphatase NUDT8 [Leguminivora glycinivorella]|uniref:mitochondrial coenzyme A diphosphatase NUDT8 n=1 Tax=Leguminivora glycinivorella TaxID=1035111 RepID=UPI00200C8F13|nr:mitochondrial coenzyme A diphosphatase NUDT8 [Leguminivora glycinivorella]